MASNQAFDFGSRKFVALLMPSPWRAWCAWLIFASVVATVVAVAPDYRTVTPNYRDACHNWFEGRPIYPPGVHGFLYFPHAAILFAPFSYAPPPMGEALWRIVSIGSLAWAVRRLSILKTQNPAPAAKSSHEATWRLTFVLMTCAAIPPAIASARNGQMNLLLAALTALAFVELAQKRWRAAAFWLCLGAAFKPLMIVPMGVAAVVYRPALRPLAVGAFGLFLAPFLTQHPNYVWQQYQTCVHKLFLAGNPGSENPGSDLFGLLSFLGYAAPLIVQTTTRIIAGALTVALALVALRRRRPVYAAWSVLALTTCYLALFNPRMENNGFVVLSPTLGLLAADAFLNRRNLLTGTMILVASLGIAGSYEITRGYNFWLCPLLTLFVWAHVIRDALARDDKVPAGELALGSASPDVADNGRDRRDQRQGRHQNQVDLDWQQAVS
ncbi:MAG TPA: glycosyltransferase family 87 protein [Pirellulales bacterium]|nr:glycosyltransferase family 87 protein [Pirellulales bacterium]